MGKFVKGLSGNPAGKKLGTRNKLTNEARKLLEESTPEVLIAMIEAAKAGDTGAAKLILDRVLPRRIRPALTLPRLNTTNNMQEAISIIAEHAAQGALDADDAKSLSSIIESAARLLDLHGQYNMILQVILDETCAASPEFAQRITERLAAIDLDSLRPASTLHFAGETP